MRRLLGRSRFGQRLWHSVLWTERPGKCGKAALRDGEILRRGKRMGRERDRAQAGQQG